MSIQFEGAVVPAIQDIRAKAEASYTRGIPAREYIGVGPSAFEGQSEDPDYGAELQQWRPHPLDQIHHCVQTKAVINGRYRTAEFDHTAADLERRRARYV